LFYDEAYGVCLDFVVWNCVVLSSAICLSEISTWAGRDEEKGREEKRREEKSSGENKRAYDLESGAGKREIGVHPSSSSLLAMSFGNV
jgi:hypothetical protein